MLTHMRLHKIASERKHIFHSLSMNRDRKSRACGPMQRCTVSAVHCSEHQKGESMSASAGVVHDANQREQVCNAEQC